MSERCRQIVANTGRRRMAARGRQFAVSMRCDHFLSLSLFLLGSAARAIQVCGCWYAEMASLRTAWQTCGLRIRTARARFWVGVVEHAGAMEIIDTDGDHLHFQIDSSGSLQEFLNGQLEIDRITELHYDAASRKVTDDTGEFCLRVDSQVDEARGLRSLAELAGVPWTGDEPVAPAAGQHTRVVGKGHAAVSASVAAPAPSAGQHATSIRCWQLCRRRAAVSLQLLVCFNVLPFAGDLRGRQAVDSCRQ